MTDEQTKLVNYFIKYETARGINIRSLKKVKYLLKIYFKYLTEVDLSIYSAKHKDAQNFQTWLTTITDDKNKILYSSSYIHGIIWCCKNFYSYLKRSNKVPSNPFNQIRRVKMEKRVLRDIPDEKRLSDFLNEMKCFWKVKGLRNKRYVYKVHVISELMYSTGLRINEIASLRIDDVDFDRGLIKVREGKGGLDRTCYLNEYACNILKLFIEDMRDIVNENRNSALIFGCKDGKSLNNSVGRWLKIKGKLFDFKNFTSHYFRHSLGYHLLKSGCDLRYIQLILGHNALSSTTIYTKVNKKDLKSELDKYHPRVFARGKRQEIQE